MESKLFNLILGALLKKAQLDSTDVGDEVTLAKDRLSRKGRKFDLRLVAERKQ